MPLNRTIRFKRSKNESQDARQTDCGICSPPSYIFLIQPWPVRCPKWRIPADLDPEKSAAKWWRSGAQDCFLHVFHSFTVASLECCESKERLADTLTACVTMISCIPPYSTIELSRTRFWHVSALIRLRDSTKTSAPQVKSSWNHHRTWFLFFVWTHSFQTDQTNRDDTRAAQGDTVFGGPCISTYHI